MYGKASDIDYNLMNAIKDTIVDKNIIELPYDL